MLLRVNSRVPRFVISEVSISRIIRVLRFFFGTVKGLCPQHAAQALSEDLRPEKSIIDVLRRNWDYNNQNNFSDAGGYALCCVCSESLASDRAKHPVQLIEETLEALFVPKQRIQTIVWLQTIAQRGFGTCFDCSLLTHTDVEYNANLDFVETELDSLAQADLA